MPALAARPRHHFGTETAPKLGWVKTRDNYYDQISTDTVEPVTVNAANGSVIRSSDPKLYVAEDARDAVRLGKQLAGVSDALVGADRLSDGRYWVSALGAESERGDFDPLPEDFMRNPGDSTTVDRHWYEPFTPAPGPKYLIDTEKAWRLGAGGKYS